MLSLPTFQVGPSPKDMSIHTPLDKYKYKKVSAHFGHTITQSDLSKSRKEKKPKIWNWWRMSLEVWFMEYLPYYISHWKYVVGLLLMTFAMKKEDITWHLEGWSIWSWVLDISLWFDSIRREFLWVSPWSGFALAWSLYLVLFCFMWYSCFTFW